MGDDDGCFAAAFEAVNRFGGVLEHPEASHAWAAFAIGRPARRGWSRSLFGGWVCQVEQGHYGHPARKKTWLYARVEEPPALRWGYSGEKLRLDEGYHSAEERRRAVKTGVRQRLSKRQRAATPIAFRDLLISIAESVNP